MAFMYDENNDVVSFAEPCDVTDKDQRIFDANECLTEAVVLNDLERATERILTKLKASSWWKKINSSTTMSALPDVDANLIIARTQDFTDLCVYSALADYILPGIADFNNPDNAERQKMGYYDLRAQGLFVELTTLCDWYDIDSSGSIETDETSDQVYSLKRIR